METCVSTHRDGGIWQLHLLKTCWGEKTGAIMAKVHVNRGDGGVEPDSFSGGQTKHKVLSWQVCLSSTFWTILPYNRQLTKNRKHQFLSVFVLFSDSSDFTTVWKLIWPVYFNKCGSCYYIIYLFFELTPSEEISLRHCSSFLSKVFFVHFSTLSL